MDPTVVYLPKALLDASTPFSFDVGGSLVKIAYKPIQEYPAKEGLSAVCLSSIPSGPQAPSRVLEFLRQHADLSGLGPGTTLTCTGVGAVKIRALLEEELKVKFKTAFEFDCNIGTFHSLYGKLPHDEMFYQVPDPLVPQTVQLSVDNIKFAINLHSKMGLKRSVKEEYPKEAIEALMTMDVQQTPVPVLDEVLGLCIAPPEETFPAMMVTIGSGISYLKVFGDGQFKYTGSCHRAGAMFVGLGRVITGAKDFDELIGLAEQGDCRKVDTIAADYMKEVDEEGAEENAYKGMPQDLPFYCFGKARGADRENFRREDLAAALLSMLVMDLVQSSVGAALALECRSVILAGSFVEHPVVRASMMRRVMLDNAAIKEKRLPFLFLRNGSHYGALGAIMGVDDPANITPHSNDTSTTS